MLSCGEQLFTDNPVKCVMDVFSLTKHTNPCEWLLITSTI